MKSGSALIFSNEKLQFHLLANKQSINCCFSNFRELLNNSKNNVRNDSKLQIWANLKRSQFDADLHWAARKLKTWGAFKIVDDCFVSGTVITVWNFKIFISLRFYVKSILWILEVQKLPFLLF